MRSIQSISTKYRTFSTYSQLSYRKAKDVKDYSKIKNCKYITSYP